MDTPGYCDRNAAGNAFLATSSITLAVACVLVPLRVYVRLKMVRCFWWDDATIIAALAIVIPAFSVLYQTMALGLGKHETCIPLSNALTIGKLVYVAEVLEIFSAIVTRISVALFVTRLFAVKAALKRILLAYTVFMALALGATGVLIFLQCRPAKALWDPMVKGKCWSPSTRSFLNYFNGGVSIPSDFLLALLPAYFLRTMQMQQKLKVAVGTFLGLGLIPGVCATVRTGVSYVLASDDPIYNLTLLIVFGSLESSMAIICATIPTLLPLFSKERRNRNAHYRYQNDSSSKKWASHDKNRVDVHASDRGKSHSQTPDDMAWTHSEDGTPLVPLGGIERRYDIRIE